MSPHARMRVAVIDDYPVFASALSDSLALERDVEIVGTYTGPDAAAADPAFTRASLVLLDAVLGGDTPQCGRNIRKLRRVNSHAYILILSGFPEGRTVKDALAAGADGFIYKGETIDHLLHAMRGVSSGTLTVAVSAEARRQLALRESSGEPDLPDRVLEVVDHLAAGESTEQIAAELDISVATVRNHIWRALKLTGMRNRTALVVWRQAQRNVTTSTPFDQRLERRPSV